MLDEATKCQRFGSVCFFAGLPAFSFYENGEIKKKERDFMRAVCAAPIAAARLFSEVQTAFTMITVKA